MKIVNLLKYQLQTYFKGSSFIMPFVVTAICMYVMYSVKPLEIISSYLISGVIIFLVMVWIGMTTAHNERVVEEQILYLRMENSVSYYCGKFLFLFCIALLLDVIYTFFPVISNMINGYALFTERLGTFEVINAFILQLGTALLGGSVGNLLHPRIMRDRKLAIVITVLVVVIAITIPVLEQQYPILKLFLWIFPPVVLPSEIYGKAVVFNLNQTFLIFITMLAYTAVYAGIKGLLCSRKRW